MTIRPAPARYPRPPQPAGVLIAVVTALLAASSARAQTAVADDRAAAVALYLANGCGVCHRFEPAASNGIFGPLHDDMAAVAEARIRDPGYRGEAETAAEYVRESIVAPQAYLVPEYRLARMQMPAYGNLSDEELNHLVDLLMRP